MRGIHVSIVAVVVRNQSAEQKMFYSVLCLALAVVQCLSAPLDHTIWGPFFPSPKDDILIPIDPEVNNYFDPNVPSDEKFLTRNAPLIAPSPDIANPTVQAIHDQIVSALKIAHDGIPGDKLLATASQVFHDAGSILRTDNAVLDWKEIRESLSQVRPAINVLGPLNGDLVLWDALALMLETTSDQEDVDTVLGAIQIVSDSILSNTLTSGDVIVYTNVPYPLPAPPQDG